MASRIVSGVVNADRTILSSSGEFSVSPRVEGGVYTIVFSEEFSSVPAVTATVLLSPNAGYARVAYLQVLTEKQVQLRIRDASPSHQASADFPFAFIAVGY